MRSEQDRLANNLLKQEPELLQQWLDRVWTGDRPAPTSLLWWAGLGFGAGQNAIQSADEGKKDQALAWARAAVLIYQFVADKGPSTGRIAREESAMSLRIFLIKKYGSLTGDSILDSSAVRQWFFDRLPMSLKEVKSRSTDSAEMPAGLRNRLLSTTYRVSIIKSAMDAGYFTDDKELGEWVKLVGDLDK